MLFNWWRTLSSIKRNALIWQTNSQPLLRNLWSRRDSLSKIWVDHRKCCARWRSMALVDLQPMQIRQSRCTLTTAPLYACRRDKTLSKSWVLVVKSLFSICVQFREIRSPNANFRTIFRCRWSSSTGYSWRLKSKNLASSKKLNRKRRSSLKWTKSSVLLTTLAAHKTHQRLQSSNSRQMGLKIKRTAATSTSSSSKCIKITHTRKSC